MSELYPLPSHYDEQEPEMSENPTVETALINTILDVISQGKTLKEINGISDEMMDTVYAHAYDFFQNGKFNDAEVLFQFLYTHDIYNARYVTGLAAVFQQKKNHARAVDLYALAYELDNTNSLPLLYSGQCFLFLKNKDQARRCFAEFLETDAKDVFKKQATAYLSVLQPAKQVGESHGSN